MQIANEIGVLGPTSGAVRASGRSSLPTIDIAPAVQEKMKLNGEKYPVELARGTALKYSKLQPQDRISRRDR